MKPRIHRSGDRITPALHAALAALLAEPRSVDAFGFVHYLDALRLDAVRDAYAETRT